MTGLETNPRISVTGDSIEYPARCSSSLSRSFREYGHVVSYAGEGVASVYLPKQFFVLSITHAVLIGHHKITGEVPWLLHVGFSHGYANWRYAGRRIEIMPHSYKAMVHYRR